MTLIRIGFTATLVGLAAAGLLGAAFAGERPAPQSVAEGARPARLSAPCPNSAPPGTILWKFQTEADAWSVAITGIPLVGDDESVHVVNLAARLYRVDCKGGLRWVFTYQDSQNSPVSLDGAPSLGEDGAILVGGNAFSPNMFFAVAPDGAPRWVYPHERERFNASSAMDRAGRIMVATSGKDSNGSTGSILAFTPSGTLLPGFPLRAAEINVAPVILADDRVVFISSPGARNHFPTPEPEPIHPTPTPWPGAVSVLHLPVNWTETNRRRPMSTASPQPTARPNERPAPSPRVVIVPAELYVLSGAQPPAAVLELPDLSPASAMAAAGGMVVLEMIDRAPHLAAFDVAAQPPRLLWEHFLLADVAGAPLIGRRDPADGRYELVYLDRASTLVSLMVPGAAAPGDPASPAGMTFNWAVKRSGSAQSAGAPALGDAGIVYVAAGNAVEAYRREDGALVWSTDIGPDVATGSVTLGPGGVLYVGTTSGRLLAIATESKGLDPEAAWPALRHDARNTGRTDR